MTLLQRISVCCLLWSAATAQAQISTVKVNTSNNNPNEVTIAINRLNPSLMVAASNINNLYVSLDSGQTWKESTLESPLGIWGDPVLHADRNGDLFIAHLGKNDKLKYPEWIDCIVVQKWKYHADSVMVFNKGAGVGLQTPKMQDKPWLVTDISGSQYDGRVYVSWTEFDKYKSTDTAEHSRIRFAISSDRGLTFEPGVVVSDSVGDCLDDDHTLEGAVPAVGGDGTVYVAWAGHGNIYFDQSADGGKTFGRDRIIATQNAGWNQDIDYIYRANGMPFLQADQSMLSPYNGNLYLVYGNNASGDHDILFTRSVDNGTTWTSPMRLHTDAPGNKRDQFFGNMTIDPTDGTIYAVFYDRRHSPSNRFIDTYLAWSTDGGISFNNLRLNQMPFPSPGKTRFFGDYIDVDATRGVVRPIWTEYSKDTLGVRVALLNRKLLDVVENRIDSCFLYAVYSQGNEVTVHYRAQQEGELTMKLFAQKGNKEELLTETRHTRKEDEHTFDLAGFIKEKNPGKIILRISSCNTTREEVVYTH